MSCFIYSCVGGVHAVISHVHLCTVSVQVWKNVGGKIRGEKRSAAVMRPLKVSLDEAKVTAADGRLFPEVDFQITLTCYGKTLFKDAIGQSRVSAPVCSISFEDVMQVVANMQKWF